jgi:hypothetical protein
MAGLLLSLVGFFWGLVHLPIAFGSQGWDCPSCRMGVLLVFGGSFIVSTQLLQVEIHAYKRRRK